MMRKIFLKDFVMLPQRLHGTGRRERERERERARERREPVNSERKKERFLKNYAILPHSLAEGERHALT